MEIKLINSTHNKIGRQKPTDLAGVGTPSAFRGVESLELGPRPASFPRFKASQNSSL